ncbi:MAG: AAA family ATPase, partial [Rhodospirillaceae bacterium]|nr:AAA family ATPase [Rhodospirillaceae bacterium]
MLKFSKLRLQGFKSFVDPTELMIEPGLTGVVGPNGCGKSNLVEALKWVMGETSAKQMRGGAMDDVIFGGSSSRPSRNVAEVVVHLDNTSRKAPAMFNDADELEVVRRIERDSGSAYRVNGMDVRAKDVQLLFADAASGARSTALVSQGKIGSIISSKPQDRRLLLEEAAGITGLHSRRHEAELRLRGAETNLSRLDDILITLESQLQSLKKQSRQAKRYRNISDLIQKAEALLYFIRWKAALEILNANQEKLKSAETVVASLTSNVAAATTAQAEAAEGVPELRNKEAEAAAALQRFTLAREGLDREADRIEAARLDRVHRLEQVKHDIARERELAEDAAEASRGLANEQRQIEAAREDETETLSTSESALSEASAVVAGIESKLAELTDRISAQDSERAGLTHAGTELETRLERLSERLAELSAQQTEVETEASADSGLDQAMQTLSDADDAQANANARLEGAESAAVTSLEETEQARHALGEARVTLSRLEAEEEALSKILEHEETDMWPPLVDAVTVEVGFEAALGAALGDDLNAPANDAAPVHWSTLGPLENPASLPGGVRALSDVVSAPDALSRRLGQIGLVDSNEDGERLSSSLKQGQRLVSRDGALWRWDGFTVTSGAKTAAAQRLEQLGRLRDVRRSLEGAKSNLARIEAQAGAANDRANAAKGAEREARDTLKLNQTELNAARDTVTAIKTRVAEQNSKLEAVNQSVGTVEHDLGEAREQMADTQRALGALPDTDALRELVTERRDDLANKRTVQVECQGVHGSNQRAAEERTRRLADIGRE